MIVKHYQSLNEEDSFYYNINVVWKDKYYIYGKEAFHTLHCKKIGEELIFTWNSIEDKDF